MGATHPDTTDRSDASPSAALSRRPGLALALAAVLTLLLGAAATQQRSEPGLDAFTPEGPVADAWDEVEERFDAAGATVVAVVQAPAGADLSAPASGAVADDVRAAAGRVDGVLAEGIVDFRDDPTTLASGTRDVAGGGEVGLVAVPLAAGLTMDQQLDAARELEAAVGGDAADGHRVAVVGDALISAEIDENAADELGTLALVALVIVVVLLGLLYRRVADVVIGLVAIGVALVWTTGLMVVVGPDGLGLTGHQSAVSVIVPVLIIGLGIDFGIHLTTRYREARDDGAGWRDAATRTVSSVGAALALAATTTVLGFLTNLASPLAPLRDLGVHTALGVAASLVAAVLVVPALRQLADRRAERRSPRRPVGPAEGAARRGDALERALARMAQVPVRRPGATLSVAAAVAAVAAVGAAGLDTSFDERDFLPEGPLVTEGVDLVEAAFGGEPGETSYLLVEGDLGDPGVRTALEETQGRLAGVDGVVTADGVALSTVLAADDGRSAALAVATSGTPSTADDLARGLEAAAAPLVDAGIRVTATSQDMATASVHDALAGSQLSGLALTLGATTALLVLVQLRRRRVVLGLAGVVPAALGAIWTGGAMVLLGYELNALTIMVSALAVGIGVPFGIHVAARYARELDAGVAPERALVRTVERTGRAVLGSALTTAAGFAALALSANDAIRQLGTITVVTVVASAVAALVVQPALLAASARGRAAQHPGAPDPRRTDERAVEAVS